MTVNRCIPFLVLLLICFSGPLASAGVISVDPASQTVNVGDAVTVDVNISDLGLFAAPSLSTFDLDVDYDPLILSPTTVVFGTELDLFGFGSIQGVAGVDPVNVFEISLDLPADLDTFQPDSFTLFTITFDAISAGVSPIEITVNALGDSFGLPLDFAVNNASVNVIPEPTSLAIFGMGAIGMAGMGLRRRKQKQAA